MAKFKNKNNALQRSNSAHRFYKIRNFERGTNNIADYHDWVIKEQNKRCSILSKKDRKKMFDYCIQYK